MKNMSLKFVIPITMVALIFLLVANFSFWLNGNIFNKQVFVNQTVKVFERPEVKNALSNEIVTSLFAGRPLLNQTLGNFAQSAVSSILGSNIIKPVIEKTAGGFNNLITAPNPKEVSIETSGISQFLIPIISGVNKQFKANIQTPNVPNKIVLIQKGQVPTIYNWAIVLLWLGPILGIMAIVLLVAMVWLAPPNRKNTVLKAIGGTILMGSLIFIALIMLFKAPVMAPIQNENAQVIVSNIYDVFAGRLLIQTWIITFTGALITAAGYAFPYFLKWLQSAFNVKISRDYQLES